MGISVWGYGERKQSSRWVGVSDENLLGEAASYKAFAFLGDVWNRWKVPPIVDPRGLPEDVSSEVYRAYYGLDHPFHVLDRALSDGSPDSPGWYSTSWLTIQELVGFNYDSTFEDHAPMIELNGQWHYQYKHIDAAHGGRFKTYREFLGLEFLERLDTLKRTNVERVVFWFG
jgi:hypothetical protein